MQPVALLLAITLTCVPIVSQADIEMAWPEATELLTRERLTAEACTRAIKKLTPPENATALVEAEQDYEAARALHNGLVANLQVVLIEDQEAIALQTVETRIEKATKARRAYCSTADALMETAAEGTKGGIGAIIGGTIGEVIKAAVSIWSKKKDLDEDRRENIRNALEDTKWPAFGTIKP